MRTTLNIDDDVAAELAGRARSEGRSLSRTANDLLRAGIRAERSAALDLPPYDPPVVDSGRPLRDVTNIAETLGWLDASV
jgi:plasmid stability protein